MRRNNGIKSYPPRHQTKRERFEWHGWEEDQRTGCWEWLGPLSESGYGVVSVPDSKGSTSAHRVAYELFVGEILPGRTIRRECENKLCVNPEHLAVRGDGNQPRRSRAYLLEELRKAERSAGIWRTRAMEVNGENSKLLEKLEEARDQIRDLTARLEEALSIR